MIPVVSSFNEITETYQKVEITKKVSSDDEQKILNCEQRVEDVVKTLINCVRQSRSNTKFSRAS